MLLRSLHEYEKPIPAVKELLVVTEGNQRFFLQPPPELLQSVLFVEISVPDCSATLRFFSNWIKIPIALERRRQLPAQGTRGLFHVLRYDTRQKDYLVSGVIRCSTDGLPFRESREQMVHICRIDHLMSCKSMNPETHI